MAWRMIRRIVSEQSFVRKPIDAVPERMTNPVGSQYVKYSTVVEWNQKDVDLRSLSVMTVIVNFILLFWTRTYNNYFVLSQKIYFRGSAAVDIPSDSSTSALLRTTGVDMWSRS